jgi:hypothetical protein
VKKQLPTLETELLPSCCRLLDLLTTAATSYCYCCCCCSWLESLSTQITIHFKKLPAFLTPFFAGRRSCKPKFCTELEMKNIIKAKKKNSKKKSLTLGSETEKLCERKTERERAREREQGEQGDGVTQQTNKQASKQVSKQRKEQRKHRKKERIL